MGLRFYGDFTNDNGDTFRVGIHDSSYAAAPVEVTLGVPGFTLTYEGDNQDQYQPIIPSRLNWTVYNEGGDFDTFLNTIIPTAAEARFLVEVLREPDEIDESVFWRGVLLPEQIQQMDEPTPSAVELTAGDDIAELKEHTVENISIGSGIGYVHYCLQFTRQHSLYGSSDLFLRYANDYYPDGYTGGDWLYESGFTEPTIPGTLPVEWYNAFDVLRSIAIIHNARVFQAEGVWYFWPMNKFQQRSDGDTFQDDLGALTADGSASTWTTLERINFVSNVLFASGFEKLAGNTIEFSRPTKRVERVRSIKASEWLFQANTNFTQLDSATDDISFSDDDRTYFAGSTHLLTLNYNIDIAAVTSENNYINNHTIRADFTIKFGDQYYTDLGWSSTAATKKVVLGTYFKNFGFESIGQVSVQVPELVDDESGLDVTLNVVVLNGAGGDIVSSLPSHDVLFILRIYPGDSSDSLGDTITYASETSADNQVVLVQDNVIMGNSLVNYSTGVTGVQWGSGSYAAYPGADMNTWYSSQDATGYGLQRLGVREIMYNTQLPHRVRQGGLALTASTWLWPYHVIRENSEDHVPHELSYNANNHEVHCERFELNASTSNISFRTEQVKSDNPRDRFAPAGNAYADDIATAYDDAFTGRRAKFVVVQEVTHSNGSSYTIDVDDSDGYIYMNGYTGANGYGRLYLPKSADNEGRLLRFKTDSTISSNGYYRIILTADEITNGVRIDGATYQDMDRPYDGVMLLCYDGQWYIIQRKSK